jgi:hypothetical protein
MRNMKMVFSEALYSTATSFDKLAELQQNIIQCTDTDIELIFQMDKKRTGLTFAFCLSLLPFIAKACGKKIVITYNQKLLHCMKKIGCIDVISNTNIIQELTDERRIIRDVGTISKLVAEIVETVPVNMNDKLHEKFTSKIGEMFNNSLEHAGAKYTVGAAYFKNNQKSLYCFSCYDTGIGIPEKVMQYHRATSNKELSQEEAFRWAMQKGKSTANMPNQAQLIPRGLGMELLKSFAEKNEGTIKICSGNVLYAYSKKKSEQYRERYHLLKNKFFGTLFEMDIVKDDKHQYIIS